jgi:glucokinase
MSTILAVDLGGTNCRIGVARSEALDAVRLVSHGPAPDSRDAFVALLRESMVEHGAQALGIGIPGLADNTRCRWVPNLPFLDGLDLAEVLPGIRIGLGNDAQLSLLAEALSGTAMGMDDAILLAIGSGIGSAVLADGAIISGNLGAACSFGWACADMDASPDDHCGWLERQASGSALDRLAQSAGWGNGASLIAQARSGEPAAVAALEPPMHILGTTLVGAIALLAPRAVILAGGVVAAFDVLAPLIESRLMRLLPPHLRQVQLLAARHGPGAGLIGAAYAGALGPAWRTRHG